MDEETKKELVEIFHRALDERTQISIHTHKMHHDFIAEEIEYTQMKRERWEAVRRQVMGWGIVAFLGAIGVAVANFFSRHFNQ